MSLAHEGNPKEDTIVIAGGDVLSTATLSIDFLFFGDGQNNPDGGPNVPPNVPAPCAFLQETRPVELCPLSLNVIDRYDNGSYSGVKLHGSFVGCSGDPAGGFVFQPTTPLFAIDVLSGRRDLTNQTQGTFAGFSIVQGVVNASHLGNGLSAFAQYDALFGSPVSGFCFWVDINSTPCNFTGVVAINDVPNTRSYLGYFINADLHSDSPTILATGTLCPTNQIFNFTNNLSSNTFELSKTSGLLLSSAAVSTIVPSLIDNQPNWGFIWLPNATNGVHEAEYGYGFSPWDIT